MQTQPFKPGEILSWARKEGDTTTRHSVSFIAYRNDQEAFVGWGLNRDSGELNRYTADLSELSRPGPSNPDPTFFPGGKLHEVRKSPQRLTVEAIQRRLLDARQKLKQAHEAAALIRQHIDSAREVADRAAVGLASAQAELRLLEQHDEGRQREIELAIKENREPVFRSNGLDRTEVASRVDALEQAKTKFDAALAEANLRHAEAVRVVHATARAVISQMVAISANTLQILDAVTARLRSELTAVAAWRPAGSLDLLHLDEVTASYIGSPVVHFTEHPQARVFEFSLDKKLGTCLRRTDWGELELHLSR